MVENKTTTEVLDLCAFREAVNWNPVSKLPRRAKEVANLGDFKGAVTLTPTSSSYYMSPEAWSRDVGWDKIPDSRNTDIPENMEKAYRLIEEECRF